MPAEYSRSKPPDHDENHSGQYGKHRKSRALQDIEEQSATAPRRAKRFQVGQACLIGAGDTVLIKLHPEFRYPVLFAGMKQIFCLAPDLSRQQASTPAQLFSQTLATDTQPNRHQPGNVICHLRYGHNRHPLPPPDRLAPEPSRRNGLEAAASPV